MSTRPGDVPEEQLASESAAIKQAEGQSTNDPIIEVVSQTQEVIPDVVQEPVEDERLAILNARAQKNAPEKPEQQDEEQLDLPIWRSNDGKLMTHAKINGADVEVPYDEVLTGYQKVSAANQKFRDAAALRQENDQLRAQIAQSQKSQPSNDVGVSGLSNDDQQGITPETLNKAFLDGDEQAQQALTARLNQKVDVDQLTQQATANALRAVQEENHRNQIKQAIAAVSSADPVYAQISADEDFFGIADRASVAIFEQEPDLTPQQLVEKAFEHTAKKLNLRQAPLSTRNASKRQHAQANTSGGTTRQPLVQEVTPLTPEMVRAQMRASRPS